MLPLRRSHAGAVLVLAVHAMGRAMILVSLWLQYQLWDLAMWMAMAAYAAPQHMEQSAAEHGALCSALQGPGPCGAPVGQNAFVFFRGQSYPVLSCPAVFFRGQSCTVLYCFLLSDNNVSGRSR